MVYQSGLDETQDKLLLEIAKTNDAIAIKQTELAEHEAILTREQEINDALRTDVAAAEEVNSELTKLLAEHKSTLEAAEAQHAAEMKDRKERQSSVSMRRSGVRMPEHLSKCNYK